jgi:hypothetical protein
MSEPVRPLGPLEKIKEVLEAWLDKGIPLEVYHSELARVRTSLDAASAQLQTVQFPEGFAAGETLKQVGQSAFGTFARTMDMLRDEAETLTADQAQQTLDVLCQAFEVLQQTLKATQNQRAGG